MNWIAPILAFSGIFVGLWAFIKYIILIEIRIDNNTFRTLYDITKDKRKFIIYEEFFTEQRHPVTYKSFCTFDDCPWFFINHSERLLQAGFQGKDLITVIVCLRWKSNKLKKFLKDNLQQLQIKLFGVPVRIATPWNTDKIGCIKNANVPILDENLWRDFDDEISIVLENGGKTGAILYGDPGNGKTSYVKYLAIKYNLPITIITFVPEFTNIDIMYMFSQIAPNTIVLLADFDNYFDKRKCIIGEGNNGSNNMGIKFTFDAILNCLDGVYNTYEKVIFIMTANEINKIDDAIKNRPSRFKYVKFFQKPNHELRYKIIEDWANDTNDLNLDQIFRLKEFKQQGFNLSESKKKLDIKEDVIVDSNNYLKYL